MLLQINVYKMLCPYNQESIESQLQRSCIAHAICKRYDCKRKPRVVHGWCCLELPVCGVLIIAYVTRSDNQSTKSLGRSRDKQRKQHGDAILSTYLFSTFSHCSLRVQVAGELKTVTYATPPMEDRRKKERKVSAYTHVKRDTPSRGKDWRLRLMFDLQMTS